MKTGRRLVALLIVVAVAPAASADPGALQKALDAGARALGQEAPVLPQAPPTPTAAFVDSPAATDGEQVNFSFDQMSTRMEAVIIGRAGRHHRKARSSGVTPADRVERGEIHYIVLHSACGTYEGAIATLLSRPTAAHFIVSAQGAVTRMVDIANIANHVKNPDIKAHSVGIETETGLTRAPWFSRNDWDPDARWRLYASLARLIRAIAHETNLPIDRQHVITHEESDRGMRDAHTDPGPMFDGDSYPAFETRFPGQHVTPREYLMRLAASQTLPDIELTTAVDGRTQIEASDPARLGLAELTMTLSVLGGATVKVVDWKAPVVGLPPATLDQPLPLIPGTYRVEATDLVGNKRSRTIVVSLTGAK
jgi:N-acetyl-anhydromuramyl-L-alanine amidase AmpD